MYPAYNPYTGMAGEIPAEVPQSTALTTDQIKAICEKGQELGRIYAQSGYDAAYAKAQEWVTQIPEVSGLVREPKVMDYLAQCMLEGYYQGRKEKEGPNYKAYGIGGAAGLLLGLLGGYALASRSSL